MRNKLALFLRALCKKRVGLWSQVEHIVRLFFVDQFAIRTLGLKGETEPGAGPLG